MTESRQTLITATIDAQEQVTHSMLALATPDWLALDLTLTQLKSVMVLRSTGPIPIHQLAEALRLGRPATSTLVEQLVRLALVTRMEDPTDRRRTLVSLTPAGNAFITRLRQGRDDTMHALLDTLSDDDLITLTRILQTLAHHAQALR